MDEKAFRAIAVIGSGQMGAGIAQVCATAGRTVVLVDKDEGQLERARSGIEASVAKLVQKGRLPADATSGVARGLTLSADLAAIGEADLVIEAIVENEGVKAGLFAEVAGLVRREAVIASNTSSISITRLAAAVPEPGRFVGLHFMNPVPLMPLVEIIPGLETAPEVLAGVQAFATTALQKTTIVSRDFPGFVVNRILMPMINEAFTALLEGVASAEDIDAGMKLGTNQPMGPLRLADLIGLDTCLAIMRVLHDGLGDDRYRPSPLLIQYVDAGRLGRKRGRGVYDYDPPASQS